MSPSVRLLTSSSRDTLLRLNVARLTDGQIPRITCLYDIRDIGAIRCSMHIRCEDSMQGCSILTHTINVMLFYVRQAWLQNTYILYPSYAIIPTSLVRRSPVPLHR